MTPMRRGSIRRVSVRRRALLDAPERDAVWQGVLARDRDCLLAARTDQNRWLAGPCFGLLTPHHLLKASHGGPFSPANIVVLCARHNGWVEDVPVLAHSLGLVVRSGETVALAWDRLAEHGLATVL
jgi:hypothetical protein